MRLSKYDGSKSLMIRIANWFTKRQFGKEFTPTNVIYARKPELLSFAMKIAKFESKQNSLEPSLRILIKLSGATANGCQFCQDIALATAVRAELGTERFRALTDGTPGVFTEPEQAVLDVLGEYNQQRTVSDDSFERLKKHFSEVQIIEILALNAFEQFYNALTVPLGIGSDGLEQIAVGSAR